MSGKAFVQQLRLKTTRFSTQLRNAAIENPERVLYVGIAILIVGLLTELGITNCVDAFSKSGSVLVAFTLCVVFVNHMLSNSIGLQRAKLSKFEASIPALKLKTIEETRLKIRKQLGDGVVNRNTSQVESIIAESAEGYENRLSTIWDEEREKLSEDIEKWETLGFVELMCGIAGTLVWGFGDIVCS